MLPFIYVKKESLQSIVSQLAAVDGFSIHSIGKFKFICESLSAKGFRLPSSNSSIMNLTYSECNDIQKEIKTEIEIEVKANTRFSVTMDEYTNSLLPKIHEYQRLWPKRCYEFGSYNNA